MALMEIEDESFGGIVVNNNPGGGFESTDGDDYWSWRGTWFPATGWEMQISTGSVSDVDLVFTSYAFDTDTEIPSPKFGGNTFVIQKNGTRVGWLEAYVSGGQAKLMWWSNGQQLTRTRKIAVAKGDTLSFTPASLPTSKQYPLDHYQG